MKIAMIGLGRMGSQMTRRLLQGGHECFVFDEAPEKAKSLVSEGAKALSSLSDLKASLGSPAIVWVMLPSGSITDQVIHELSSRLSEGDILIDGGNTHYVDDVKRAKVLQEKGIRFLDVGVSGGVWGYERGYCLMIGGDRDASALLDPIFKTLSPGASSETSESQTTSSQSHRTSQRTSLEGYLYCGPAGSGHFVKMIHNGIEYGMMQSLAEGFNLLNGAKSETLPSDRRYDLDLREIAEVWRRGSVVSSWLLDLTALALNHDPQLSKFQGRVPDSGEGRWTVEAAIEQGTPAEVIATSLFVRFRSRQAESFAEKVLSAMRSEFGGHAEAPLEGLLHQPVSERKVS